MGSQDFLGKRIRVTAHVAAPPALVGLEGVVIDYRQLELDDDDLLLVELDDARQVFVPVDAAEVLP